MFDFLKVSKQWDNKKARYIYSPTFVIKSNIKDLMIRQRDFYAIYNEETGFWEMNEARAIELIDEQVREYAMKDGGDSMTDEAHGPIIKLLSDTDNRLIQKWHGYCQKDLRDKWTTLNQKVIFSNQKPERKDYATHRLDYALEETPTPAYDKLCETLYLPTEQQKWEWFVGCCLAGDASKIQKAIIFYGEPGSGKSTIAEKIIGEGVFGGYASEGGYAGSFDATALAESKDSFGTDFLEDDPVIAIDGEAKMSVINARGTFNKIISHESTRVNAKFKATYYVKPSCLLIMCANDPVQISPNSGLRRRIIDIQPTGNLLPADQYDWVIGQIPFERSGIAYKCLHTYKKLGRHYYDHYISEDMMNRTSPFQNFVVENYPVLKDGISLARAYDLYKSYAETCNFKNVLARYKFRDTLKLYFDSYDNMHFDGFKKEKIGLQEPVERETKPLPESGWLQFDSTESVLDIQFADCPAQYETDDPKHPLKYKWENCPTKLRDLDTHRIHYVKPPDVKYITIDFDIYGEDGSKSFDLNVKAANMFPPTYAELSKSGSGIHLEYIWKGGDPTELSSIFGPNIEIKVFKGGGSLRRKLTKCNSLPIASLASGLPLKEVKKKMVNQDEFVSEKKLVNVIKKCLTFDNVTKTGGYSDKGLTSTTQHINFIEDLLAEAYASGKSYDVRKLMPAVDAFARRSHNHQDQCMEAVNRMLWCSEDILKDGAPPDPAASSEEFDQRPIIFLDCEIFPSYRQSKAAGVDVSDIPEDTPALFLINWKLAGEGKQMVRMINPKPSEVEKLWETYRIIGFNNRNYDNHMLWAAGQGYTPEELYILSGKLIDKKTQFSARFGQAYNISYTDIYDFLSAGNKMSLKKWEIKLQNEGKLVKHLEWNHPWDQPVPKDQWIKVAEYCDNDVLSTEALFEYRHDNDWLARKILAALAKNYGGTVNSTTNNLTNMIVFEGNKHPGLVYTDFTTGKQYGPGETFKMPILSWEEYEALGDDWTGVKPINVNHFPGYHLVRDVKGKLHNMFRGVDVGFGGYVYANPGMYGRAVTKDVASMHPHSIQALNLFGEYTQNYVDLMNARIFIKHKQYKEAEKLFHGALTPYLKDEKSAKGLSKALKTALNSAYGLTSAGFQNPMKDIRNVNNIVALRGALVMKTLQDEVESRGFTVIHIKTDSIKIANPTEDILKFVDEFGKRYGYVYEVEHTWDRICLVNDAVFIGRHDVDDPDYISDPEGSEKDYPNRWEATGTQFKVPYVFKNLFSHQKIEFQDKCQTINVMEGSLHLVTDDEHEVDHFVGRVGSFCPMKKGYGQYLYRIKDGKRYSPGGTKDYLWEESDVVESHHWEDQIDESYYTKMCDKAVETINKFGDFNTFADVS